VESKYCGDTMFKRQNEEDSVYQSKKDMNITELDMEFDDLQSSYRKTKIREGKYKREVRKEYKRISASCIKGSKKSKKAISKDVTQKILIVSLTSILTYLGVYQVTFRYVQNQMDKTNFYLLVVGLIVLGTSLMTFFVVRKDFAKTQFMLYFIVYSLFSFAHIIFMVVRFIPITSYSIINTYLVILGVQLLLFGLITPVVRRMVCRVDMPYEVM
jgi:hypothetical protein